MLLRPKDKEALQTIFGTVPMPIEVWAYGSRVTGGAHTGSDLDLVIRSADLSPLPPAIYNEVYWKIKDSNIPILVDLFDWSRLNETFHKNISQQYEVLFSSINSNTETASATS